ncbi:hypothetical protein BT63DRAFT_457318 [Microthyrium microscopicum]|uniref:DUF7730 domain-containing protein n=1 Tax=Microthyrium microscopicum TaxID=703497 RepID=A0A6A6U993_9PEZI|nr:hypothetical protein BT63DRAFT_457318 [Microthyrium microscopicum]
MSARNSSSYCAFLEQFPLEIRRMIYVELLGALVHLAPARDNTGGYVACIEQREPPCERKVLSSQSLRTCKQVFDEAEEVLYQQNAFFLSPAIHKHYSGHFLSRGLRAMPYHQMNLISIVRIDLIPTTFRFLSIEIVLDQLKSVHTVEAISTWPKRCDVKRNTLYTLKKLGEKVNQTPRLRLSCTFSIPWLHKGWSTGCGRNFNKAHRHWLRCALGRPNIVTKALQDSTYVEDDTDTAKDPVPPSFSLHRYWMGLIKADFQRQETLPGVPIAWNFSTLKSEGSEDAIAWIKMTANMRRDHITCEIMNDKQVLWQGLEEVETAGLSEEEEDSNAEEASTSEEDLTSGGEWSSGEEQDSDEE